MEFNPIGPFPGIYIIIIGTERYIGSSNNINKRITEHKRTLSNNTHCNYKLQKAYNDSDGVMLCYCIEYCDEADLFDVEQKYLDCEKPELNISLLSKCGKLTYEQINEKQGGERNHKAKITLEQAISVVRERNNKLTLKEISEKLNITYPTVVSICSANAWEYDLTRSIPEEYAIFKSNIKSLGLENKGRTPPKNRLFNDITLRDVIQMLFEGHTLQHIATKYNTSKAVISSIKNYNVYKKDIQRVLTEHEFEYLLSNEFKEDRNRIWK